MSVVTLPVIFPTTELPREVFGTSKDDSFDTKVPGAQQFVGDNQTLFTDGGNDTVDITFAPGGGNSRVDLGTGDDLLYSPGKILPGDF